MPANQSNHGHPVPASQLDGLTKLGLILSVLLVGCFAVIVTWLPNDHDCPPGARLWPAYNVTPLGVPIHLDDGSVVYTVSVVTDLDHESKSDTEKNTWYSYLLKGTLTLNKDRSKAAIQWQTDAPRTVKSTMSTGGRGMELSDLKVFDGHLISVDDRTGLLFRLDGSTPVPWVFLSDGAGNVSKGLKGEWMAVKDQELFVGGLGKEWTTTEGVFVNHNPMWIKVISHVGYVRHVNWVEQYKRLRRAAGINYPGYMIHESAQWSNVHKKWFFMPRRASHDLYTEAADETRGTNFLLIADESFDKIEVKRVGDIIPPRGFSAFQFLPDTSDQIIVALKSEEKDGRPVGSYLSVFKIDGTVLLDDHILPGQYKYEGIEFV